jgi:septum formation protein
MEGRTRTLEPVATPGVGAHPPRLVLASRSPRRRRLLREMGVEHEPIDPGLDDAELAPGAVRGQEWVMALAYLKARAGQDRLPEAWRARAHVLAADTVCVVGGRLVGKPAGADHARDILRRFERSAHVVLTGMALVAPDGRRELSVHAASVRFGEIGAAAIDGYVRSGAWEGKAGGYNLEERLEAGWAIEVRGDPGTVTGMPVGALRRRLEAWGLA